MKTALDWQPKHIEKIDYTVLVCNLLQIITSMIRVCHKVARINKVYMLDLGHI